MTLGRLLLRNLLFHWRGNSAVVLGVAVGTAVLTGALLVGDSLRGSLRELTLRSSNGWTMPWSPAVSSAKTWPIPSRPSAWSRLCCCREQ